MLSASQFGLMLSSEHSGFDEIWSFVFIRKAKFRTWIVSQYDTNQGLWSEPNYFLDTFGKRAGLQVDLTNCGLNKVLICDLEVDKVFIT